MKSVKNLSGFLSLRLATKLVQRETQIDDYFFFVNRLVDKLMIESKRLWEDGKHYDSVCLSNVAEGVLASRDSLRFALDGQPFAIEDFSPEKFLEREEINQVCLATEKKRFFTAL